MADSHATERGRRASVSTVVACQFFHVLTIGGLALFLPLIQRDLEITFAQAGMLSAVGTLSYALCQIPAGYLADRFGPRRVYFTGLLGWSVLSFALALVNSYFWAAATLLVAGVFRAMVLVPGLAFISSWFPVARRATAMGLFQAGFFCGTIALALAGPWLAERFGWRATFGVFATLGVAAAVTFVVVVRDSVPAKTAAPVAIAEALKMFRHPILWVCGALQFIRFAVLTSFGFWLPSLLVSDRGFSLAGAGVIIAMSAALSAPANAIGGYVSDRLRNPPLVIGGALAVLAVTCVLLVQVKSTFALLAVIALSAVFLPFYFGPLFFVPIEVLGQRTAGTLIGITNLFANIGGLIAAYALGAAKDAHGAFTWGFMGIGALCLAGVALSALLARVRHAALAVPAAAAHA